MAAKIVLASRGFQKSYPQFLHKYADDLSRTFRKFLAFRATARPDQAFSQKDSRISGYKFRRCHLVHGKAILLYHLYGSELRLIALDEHNMIENGGQSLLRYAKSLTAEDYYRFDPDSPMKVSESPVKENKSVANTEMPMQESAQIESEPVESEPVEQAEVEHAPYERTVNYMHGQQLVYIPRPRRPVMILPLTEDIVASKGDMLGIDPVNESVFVLTAAEVAARYLPARQRATTISDAVAATLAPQAREVRPARERQARQPKPVADRVRRSSTRRVKAKRQPVGPQVGRMILALGYAQAVSKSDQIDSQTVRDYLPEADRKLISVLLSEAQNKKLVKKSGNKPAGGAGGRFYYCLTAAGERVRKRLGDHPFVSKGIKSVFPIAAA